MTGQSDEEHNVLQVFPQSFASYDKSINALHSVKTSPSRLESTVHMLAWGTDVYVSQLQPSQGFDTLGKDFSFFSLIIALASMTTGVLLMSILVTTRRVNAKWE